MEARRKFLTALQDMPPDDPETLAFTVAALIETHFDSKNIAQLVGADRTTVIRWAQGQSVPRSPGFRKWATETLMEALRSSLEEAA